MMKSKLKKYTNHLILVGFCTFLILLSWFISAGVYDNGVFSDSGILRAGIYDLFFLIYGSISYCLSDIMFILLVGALYFNLSKTYAYRKLVEKTSEKVEGNEKKALALIVFIMGVYASLTNEVLILFLFIPFIISVFLRCGKDRLTTLAAAFGGIFVGLIGTTFGTYGLSWFNLYGGVAVTKYIAHKIGIFVVAYVLYIIFTFLYMDKHKKRNYDLVKYDLFYAEPLTEDENKRKYKKTHKTWPTYVVLAITAIFALLSYIDWEGSFKVTIFTKLFEFLGGSLKIKGVPVVGGILGLSNMDAMGTTNDVLLISFAIIVAIIFITIFNKVSFANMLDNCGIGAKKLLKVVVLFTLCYAPLIVISYYPWAVTFFDKILSTPEFNMFSVFFTGIFVQIFMVDQTFIGFLYGQYFALSLADNVAISTLMWKTAFGLAMLVGPTSFILMIALSYLDVPYSKWIKFIWKFALSMLLILLITFGVVCYM